MTLDDARDRRGWIAFVATAAALLAWTLIVTARGDCLPHEALGRIVEEMLARGGSGPVRLDSLAAGLALNSAMLAAFGAAAWGIGGTLARALRLPLEPGGESLLAELALGIAAAIAALGTCALLGVLGLRAALALIAAGLMTALLRVRRGDRPRAGLADALAGRHGTLVSLLAAGCAMLFAATVVLCLAPELNYDALFYHLAEARLDLLHGTVPHQPHDVYSRFPQGLELLFAGALALSGDETLPRLIHASLGALTAGGAGLLAHRISDQRGGWIAATLMATTPVAVLNASTALVDFGMAFFAVAALVVLQPWFAERGNLSRPALSGLFAGFAMGCKYTGIVPAALLGLMVLAACAAARMPRSRIAAVAAAFGGFALIGIAPWLIRNALIDGNPVAPFLGSIFGETLSPESFAALLTDMRNRVATGPREWLALPWTLAVDARDWHHWLGPAWLALLPAAIVLLPGSRARRAAAWIAVFAVAGIALSLAQTHVVRFAYPALAAAAALAGAGLVRLARDRATSALAGAAIVITCTGCALAALGMALAQRECAAYLLGREGRAAYLSRSHPSLYPHPSYGVIQEANAVLPADAVVLLVGETRGFHLQRRFVVVSAFDEHPLWRWASEGLPLEEVLAREGITHVLLNERELARTGRADEARRLPAPAREALAAFWSARAPLARDGKATLVAVDPQAPP